MPGSPDPHWLVVVQRDREDLLARLRRTFGREPLVSVIADRRQADRRRGVAAAARERRRADRRRTPQLRRGLETAGYRLVERSDGFLVFEAEARLAIECGECRAPLEFEMPRFGELPARLELQVVHPGDGPLRGQHVVEAQAFRASGRPFLACRMVARRRSAGPIAGASLS
jgi:hypothetical protein